MDVRRDHLAQFVTAGGELFVLDAASGSRLSKQTLSNIANTAPVEYGQFLVYGSRDGKIVWHAPTLGTTLCSLNR